MTDKDKGSQKNLPGKYISISHVKEVEENERRPRHLVNRSHY